MFKRLLLILGFLFIAANVALVVSGKNYLYKAAIYQKPGIYDLDLFESRTLKASSEPVLWRKVPTRDQQPIPTKTLETLEKYQSVAYLVIQGGEIKQEYYWDGHNAAEISNSFSAGKSIIAAGIGAALQDGAINSLDQAVADFLPEFRKDERATITIRDVLSMASGLSFEEAYAKPISDTTEAYYGNDLDALVNRLTVIEQPGKTWYYRSGDTQVLAMVLRAATGKPVADYISERLWQPLGAQHDAQWSLDAPNGSEKAYCCFYATARDFAKMGALYLNNGRANGRQLLPEDFVKQSVIPHGLPDRKGNKTNFYGYQWWRLVHKGEEVFYMRGILGQYVFVVPGLDMIVVRLGHKRHPEKGEYFMPLEAKHYLDGAFELYGR